MARRVIVVFIVILAIGAGWWGWRAASRVSTSTPDVTLSVNHRTAIEVARGTPLVLEISISSSPSSRAFAIGHRWRPWHSLVRLETVHGEDIAPLADPGQSRSLHLTRQDDGRLGLTEEVSGVAHLEAGRHVHTVRYVISPEHAASLQTSTYALRAVVETPFWMPTGWRGRAESEPVVIVVRDASLQGKSGDLDHERLARTAEFYLSTSRFDDAFRAAAALVEAKPKEPGSHLLLGDALTGLARRPEARAAYQRALALWSRAYEQPDLILARIRSLDNGNPQ